MRQPRSGRSVGLDQRALRDCRRSRRGPRRPADAVGRLRRLAERRTAQAVSGGALGRAAGSAGAGGRVPCGFDAVVVAAQQPAVVDGGGAAVAPRDDVVDVAAVDRFVTAAVVLAVPVAGDDRLTQRTTEAAPGDAAIGRCGPSNRIVWMSSSSRCGTMSPGVTTRPVDSSHSRAKLSRRRRCSAAAGSGRCPTVPTSPGEPSPPAPRRAAAPGRVPGGRCRGRRGAVHRRARRSRR